MSGPWLPPQNTRKKTALPGLDRFLPALSAGLVALGAFALYRATMLPGFDFGDTGSFQTAVGSPLITPRDGYPLYFALGQFFVWVTRAEPAHALNLASAITAAVACGLVVLVAVELSGSTAAAVGAALLFAASYTFWSQAVIAEVYALHIALVALTLLLLLRWEQRPTLRRLAIFFAVYALAFGNHLSMILLAPAFTVFLLLAAPRGWRSLVTPRVVALALACAVAGASQYAWNLRTLWLLPGSDPPDGVVDALERFWFDVTKSDWRDTMVMNVPRSMLSDHTAMYWFDLTQQFGAVGPLLAAAGLAQLAATNSRRAILMFTLLATNTIFAFSYNVGDSHVFYLPSHLFVALLTAPAVALAGRLIENGVVPLFGSDGSRKGVRPLFRGMFAALLILYAVIRAYRDFPALDRSLDDRPSAVLAPLTAGLDDRTAILLTDLNWQVQNGLSYFAKVKRPEIAAARMPDVLLYAPVLVADNRAAGRDVALTERARTTAAAAYGPLLPIARDERVVVPRLADSTRDLAHGTRYVLCVLRPSRDLSLDAEELARALHSLTGGRTIHLPAGDYAAVAGIAGEPPVLVIAAPFPFRRTLTLDGVNVSIRMESWLTADTIRRMGFGHVIAAHQHTLIVERGVSFAAFDERGRPLQTAYSSNIFAPQARYLIDIAPITR
jgi:transmembrane protein TMEM260 (protein O-mannosyltransferase)